VKSSILDDRLFIQLWSQLPEEFKIKNANLVFNTQSHGYSLNSILNLNKHHPNTDFIIFIIETAKDEIFGGGLSCLIELTDNKYKKPMKSIVFSITPDVVVYQPEKDAENIFFCNYDCFMLGGGKNGPAIYIDNDLKSGYSSDENCFQTHSLIQSNKYGEFVLKKMEIYLLK